MLGLAKRLRVPILQASTSEVYGDPEVHPQTEAYWGRVNPIGKRSCYDEGKRCAETLFFDYHRQHNLRIKVARIFNTYGPNMHPADGRVISTFIVQALRGEPITIFGDGEQTRSLCYVDDMVDALVRLMETPDDVTGPMNLGNPNELSIAQIARRIIALTSSRSELVFLPLARGRPAAAAARHRVCEAGPAVGAGDPARHRLGEDHRSLQGRHAHRECSEATRVGVAGVGGRALAIRSEQIDAARRPHGDRHPGLQRLGVVPRADQEARCDGRHTPGHHLRCHRGGRRIDDGLAGPVPRRRRRSRTSGAWTCCISPAISGTSGRSPSASRKPTSAVATRPRS